MNWLLVLFACAICWYLLGFLGTVGARLDKKGKYTVADIPVSLWVSFLGPIILFVLWEAGKWGDNLVLFRTRGEKR